MVRRNEDAPSAEATQQPHGHPEDLSNPFDVPSATRATAAASVGRGSRAGQTTWKRLGKRQRQRPSNTNPPDYPESTTMDGTAQEQGAEDAVAALERLRAQNRRHQAAHRARRKVWCPSCHSNTFHPAPRLCPKLSHARLFRAALF